MIDKRILVATGNRQIDGMIKEYTGYNIIGHSNYTDELLSAVEKLDPEILLVTEMLSGEGQLHNELLKIKTRKPAIRIVYVLGKLDLRSERQVNRLALLVMAGIHDIVVEPKITIDMLKKSIDDKKTEEDVRYITNASDRGSNSRSNTIEFVVPKGIEEFDDNLRSNLYAISSVKPGTGKSFVSVNVATAIAEYGALNKDGKPPVVGLIEADLQNLSLGTLLQIEDDSKNIKTALDKVSEIIDEEGRLFGEARKIQEVDEYIKNCFIPYKGNRNLLALVGSQITFEELENINRFHYTYLIESVLENFDVLIIDTNSALTHTTTYPVLKMAQACYYVLNLDYNNVRNNARYRDTLRRMGLAEKVKYVLNEDITKDMEKENGEALLFTSGDLETAGFKLEAKIPVIPKSIFLNRLYEGMPMVLDKSKRNASVRKEFLTIANQIHPIKDFDKYK